jgi:hypothetical protein
VLLAAWLRPEDAGCIRVSPRNSELHFPNHMEVKKDGRNCDVEDCTEENDVTVVDNLLKGKYRPMS